MEDDATKDLAEFALANAIYAVLVEGHAAEINSRRNAMDNASKASRPCTISVAVSGTFRNKKTNVDFEISFRTLAI